MLEIFQNSLKAGSISDYFNYGKRNIHIYYRRGIFPKHFYRNIVFLECLNYKRRTHLRTLRGVK